MSIRCESIDITFKKGKKGEIEEVLKDVNLELPPNRIVMLFGHAGQGKTSLFNILGGLTSSVNSKAEVYWLDYRVKNLDDANHTRQKYLSIIFSFPFFMNSLSVEQNIALPAILAQKSKHEIKNKLEMMYDIFSFNHSFRKLNLKELIGKAVPRLSNGQKDLVAIVRALMIDTPFILADEMFRSYSEDETDALWKRLTSDPIGVGKTRGLFLITKKKHILHNYDLYRKYTIENKKLIEVQQ